MMTDEGRKEQKEREGKGTWNTIGENSARYDV